MKIRAVAARHARLPRGGNALGDEAHREPGHARQQVLRRVERDDASRLQHRDPAAQRLGLLEIVRRQDDRVAVAIELADERPQALPQLDVHARRRLVQHDHRRLVHERLADEHAALHAAGERAHVGVGLRREIEVVQDLVDPRAVVADAEIAGLDRERLAHGEERIEHELLRHDAERAARVAVVGDRRRDPARAPLPLSARVSPASTEISVVLPAPFGPSRPKNSPSSTARLTPASACTRPKRRVTLSTSTARDTIGDRWGDRTTARDRPALRTRGAAQDCAHGGEDRSYAPRISSTPYTSASAARAAGT